MSLKLLIYDNEKYGRDRDVDSFKAEGLKQLELHFKDGAIAPRWKLATIQCAEDRKTLPDVFPSPLFVSLKVRDWIVSKGFAKGIEILPVILTSQDGEKLAEYYWMRPEKVQNCVDLEASKVILNSISKRTISECSGIIVDESKLPKDQFIFRIGYLEKSVIVREEFAAKIQAEAFSGVALAELSQIKNAWEVPEPYFRARNNGATENSLPAELSTAKMSVAQVKAVLASLMKTHEGKVYAVKPEYVSSHLDRTEEDEVSLQFFDSKKIKSHLESEYQDELALMKLTDGESWTSSLVHPVAGFFLSSKKKKSPVTIKSCEAWLYFDGAKNRYFVTTSDSWDKKRIVSKIADLVE